MSFLTRITKKLSFNSQDTEGSGEGREEIKEETLSRKSSRSKDSARDKEMAQSKVNVTNVYNKCENYKPIAGHTDYTDDLRRNDKQLKQFKEIVYDVGVCDLEKLRKLAWSGVSAEMRPIVWKILLEYVPISRDKREGTIQKKRAEYLEIQRFYFNDENNGYQNESEKKTLRIIESDVHRTQPDSPLFQVDSIQKILVRLLTIWHTRHPASGYVQGMNDLTTPLVGVFLSEYVEIDLDTFNVPGGFEKTLTEDKLNEIEADTYYCLCRVLDGIQDNYTDSQPGTQRSVDKIREILKRLDHELLEHFETEEMNLMQIVIRWMFCLLIREFPLKLGMRLFDTYISDNEGFTTLHMFVCTALLLKWAQKLKKMQFHEMMLFLQSLPTKEWGEEDLQMLIAEAYVYKMLFESSTAMTHRGVKTP